MGALTESRKWSNSQKKKSPKNLKELFEGFDCEKYWNDWNKEHSNKSKEYDLGNSVGRELL